MNAPFRLPPTSPTRHKITCDEFQRMWEAGAFEDYPAMELIDGEIYEMAADGDRTIDWNAAINEWLVLSLAGQPFRVVPDKTLRIKEHYSPKPDFWVHDRAIPTREMNGRNVLLVIEVSDTTVPFDKNKKLPGYEAAGVRDHWRIECEAACVFVYRFGPDGRYGEPMRVGFSEEIEALLIPDLRLRLRDLPGLAG